MITTHGWKMTGAHYSRMRRAPRKIDFVMSIFLPEDVDHRIYDRYQMKVA